MFDYRNSPWPIRADLSEAFVYTWNKLAAPGTWLTGAQRVAIADAVRSAGACDLCGLRKAALSPFADQGQHQGQTQSTALDARAYDLVHRLSTDASRLSESWLQQQLDERFGVDHYVELLSVVVAVVSIDAFHTALGLALEPLPAPQTGEPTRKRPQGVRSGTGWVPMLSSADATAEDADIYAGMRRDANVIKAMSLVPDGVRLLRKQSAAMYLEIDDIGNPASNGERTLSRPQIELVASRVSALNDCFY